MRRWTQAVIELDKKYKPTKEIRRAAEAYVNDYMRWRTFGFKFDGGYDDQEAEYLDALEVCKMAWESVRREVEEEDRRRQEAASKKGGKQRRRL